MKLNWNKLTADMIDPAIVSVGKSSETLQLRVHKLLVAIAADWVATKDQKRAASRVQTLIETLGNGVRKNAVKSYVTAPTLFAMRVHEESGEICSGKLKAPELNDRLALIANTHWWDFTPEPTFTAFVLADRVSTLVATATTASAKNDARNDIPAEIMTMLRAVEARSVELAAVV